MALNWDWVKWASSGEFTKLSLAGEGSHTEILPVLQAAEPVGCAVFAVPATAQVEGSSEVVVVQGAPGGAAPVRVKFVAFEEVDRRFFYAPSILRRVSAPLSSRGACHSRQIWRPAATWERSLFSWPPLECGFLC